MSNIKSVILVSIILVIIAIIIILYSPYGNSEFVKYIILISSAIGITISSLYVTNKKIGKSGGFVKEKEIYQYNNSDLENEKELLKKECNIISDIFYEYDLTGDEGLYLDDMTIEEVEIIVNDYVNVVDTTFVPLKFKKYLLSIINSIISKDDALIKYVNGHPNSTIGKMYNINFIKPVKTGKAPVIRGNTKLPVSSESKSRSSKRTPVVAESKGLTSQRTPVVAESKGLTSKRTPVVAESKKPISRKPAGDKPLISNPVNTIRKVSVRRTEEIIQEPADAKKPTGTSNVPNSVNTIRKDINEERESQLMADSKSVSDMENEELNEDSKSSSDTLTNIKRKESTLKMFKDLDSLISETPKFINEEYFFSAFNSDIKKQIIDLRSTIASSERKFTNAVYLFFSILNFNQNNNNEVCSKSIINSIIKESTSKNLYEIIKMLEEKNTEIFNFIVDDAKNFPDYDTGCSVKVPLETNESFNTRKRRLRNEGGSSPSLLSLSLNSEENKTFGTARDYLHAKYKTINKKLLKLVVHYYTNRKRLDDLDKIDSKCMYILEIANNKFNEMQIASQQLIDAKAGLELELKPLEELKKNAKAEAANMIDLQTKINSLNTEKDNLIERNSSIIRQSSALEAQIALGEKSLEFKNKELKDLMTVNSELLGQIDSNSITIRDLEDKIVDLSQQLSHFDKHRDDIYKLSNLLNKPVNLFAGVNSIIKRRTGDIKEFTEKFTNYSYEIKNKISFLKSSNKTSQIIFDKTKKDYEELIQSLNKKLSDSLDIVSKNKELRESERKYIEDELEKMRTKLKKYENDIIPFIMASGSNFDGLNARMSKMINRKNSILTLLSADKFSDILKSDILKRIELLKELRIVEEDIQNELNSVFRYNTISKYNKTAEINIDNSWREYAQKSNILTNEYEKLFNNYKEMSSDYDRDRSIRTTLNAKIVLLENQIKEQNEQIDSFINIQKNNNNSLKMAEFYNSELERMKKSFEEFSGKNKPLLIQIEELKGIALYTEIQKKSIVEEKTVQYQNLLKKYEDMETKFKQNMDINLEDASQLLSKELNEIITSLDINIESVYDTNLDLINSKTSNFSKKKSIIIDKVNSMKKEILDLNSQNKIIKEKVTEMEIQIEGLKEQDRKNAIIIQDFKEQIENGKLFVGVIDKNTNPKQMKTVSEQLFETQAKCSEITNRLNDENQSIQQEIERYRNKTDLNKNHNILTLYNVQDMIINNKTESTSINVLMDLLQMINPIYIEKALTCMAILENFNLSRLLELIDYEGDKHTFILNNFSFIFTEYGQISYNNMFKKEGSSEDITLSLNDYKIFNKYCKEDESKLNIKIEELTNFINLNNSSEMEESISQYKEELSEIVNYMNYIKPNMTHMYYIDNYCYIRNSQELLGIPDLVKQTNTLYNDLITKRDVYMQTNEGDKYRLERLNNSIEKLEYKKEKLTAMEYISKDEDREHYEIDIDKQLVKIEELVKNIESKLESFISKNGRNNSLEYKKIMIQKQGISSKYSYLTYLQKQEVEKLSNYEYTDYEEMYKKYEHDKQKLRDLLYGVQKEISLSEEYYEGDPKTQLKLKQKLDRKSAILNNFLQNIESRENILIERARTVDSEQIKDLIYKMQNNMSFYLEDNEFDDREETDEKYVKMKAELKDLLFIKDIRYDMDENEKMEEEHRLRLIYENKIHRDTNSLEIYKFKQKIFKSIVSNKNNNNFNVNEIVEAVDIINCFGYYENQDDIDKLEFNESLSGNNYGKLTVEILKSLRNPNIDYSFLNKNKPLVYSVYKSFIIILYLLNNMESNDVFYTLYELVNNNKTKYLDYLNNESNIIVIELIHRLIKRNKMLKEHKDLIIEAKKYVSTVRYIIGNVLSAEMKLSKYRERDSVITKFIKKTFSMISSRETGLYEYRKYFKEVFQIGSKNDTLKLTYYNGNMYINNFEFTEILEKYNSFIFQYIEKNINTIDKLQDELTQYKKNSSSDLNELVKENVKLLEDIKTLQSDLLGSRQQIKKLETDITENKEEIEKKNKKIDELEQEKKQTKEELDIVKESLKRYQSIGDNNTDYLGLLKKKEELEDEIVKTQKYIDSHITISLNRVNQELELNIKNIKSLETEVKRLSLVEFQRNKLPDSVINKLQEIGIEVNKNKKASSSIIMSLVDVISNKGNCNIDQKQLLEDTIAELTAKKLELESSLDIINKKNNTFTSAMNAEREKYKEEIAYLKDDKSLLRNTIDGMNKDFKSDNLKLNIAIQTLQNKLITSIEQLKSLESQHTSEYINKQAEVIEMNKKLDELNKYKKETEDLRESTSNNIFTLDSKIIELNGQINKLTTELEESIKEAAFLNSQIEAKDAEIEDLESKIESEKFTENINLGDAAANPNEDLESKIESENINSGDAAINPNEELNTLKEQLANAKEEYKELERNHKDLLSMNETIKIETKELEEKRRDLLSMNDVNKEIVEATTEDWKQAISMNDVNKEIVEATTEDWKQAISMNDVNKEISKEYIENWNRAMAKLGISNEDGFQILDSYSNTKNSKIKQYINKLSSESISIILNIMSEISEIDTFISNFSKYLKRNEEKAVDYARELRNKQNELETEKSKNESLMTKMQVMEATNRQVEFMNSKLLEKTNLTTEMYNDLVEEINSVGERDSQLIKERNKLQETVDLYEGELLYYAKELNRLSEGQLSHRESINYAVEKLKTVQKNSKYKSERDMCAKIIKDSIQPSINRLENNKNSLVSVVKILKNNFKNLEDLLKNKDIKISEYVEQNKKLEASVKKIVDDSEYVKDDLNLEKEQMNDKIEDLNKELIECKRMQKISNGDIEIDKQDNVRLKEMLTENKQVFIDFINNKKKQLEDILVSVNKSISNFNSITNLSKEENDANSSLLLISKKNIEIKLKKIVKLEELMISSKGEINEDIRILVMDNEESKNYLEIIQGNIDSLKKSYDNKILQLEKEKENSINALYNIKNVKIENLKSKISELENNVTKKFLENNNNVKIMNNIDIVNNFLKNKIEPLVGELTSSTDIQKDIGEIMNSINDNLDNHLKKHSNKDTEQIIDNIVNTFNEIIKRNIIEQNTNAGIIIQLNDLIQQLSDTLISFKKNVKRQAEEELKNNLNSEYEIKKTKEQNKDIQAETEENISKLNNSIMLEKNKMNDKFSNEINKLINSYNNIATALSREGEIREGLQKLESKIINVKKFYNEKESMLNEELYNVKFNMKELTKNYDSKIESMRLLMNSNFNLSKDTIQVITDRMVSYNLKIAKILMRTGELSKKTTNLKQKNIELTNSLLKCSGYEKNLESLRTDYEENNREILLLRRTIQQMNETMILKDTEIAELTASKIDLDTQMETMKSIIENHSKSEIDKDELKKDLEVAVNESVGNINSLYNANSKLNLCEESKKKLEDRIKNIKRNINDVLNNKLVEPVRNSILSNLSNISDIKSIVKSIIDKVKLNSAIVVHNNLSNIKCPPTVVVYEEIYMPSEDVNIVFNLSGFEESKSIKKKRISEKKIESDYDKYINKIRNL